MILQRDLGYTWVNFIRVASVRLAPLDVNLDVALIDALQEAATRVMDLVEVSIMSFVKDWSGEYLC